MTIYGVTPYDPDPAPLGVDPVVAEYIQRELRKLAAAFFERDSIDLVKSDVEPAKPRDGVIIVTDGDNFNPDGSGREGFYGFINGIWLFFGGSGGGAADPAYDIHTFFPDTPGASQLINKIVFDRAVGFASAWAGSEAHCRVAPSADYVIDIQKNGVSVGSCTIASGSQVAIFSGAGATFAVDDRLQLVGPNPSNSAIKDISIMLKGEKV